MTTVAAPLPDTPAMVVLARERAPAGWTVEHLDDDGYPSQGWGAAPGGLRWYFRDRHGRWTFAVGVASSADEPVHVSESDAKRHLTGGGGLDSVAIVLTVAECMGCAS